MRSRRAVSASASSSPNRVFLKVDAGLCALTGGASSADLGQTLGVSLDYRFHRGLRLRELGAVHERVDVRNQSRRRGTALTPRQWGLDFNRVWRFDDRPAGACRRLQQVAARSPMSAGRNSRERTPWQSRSTRCLTRVHAMRIPVILCSAFVGAITPHALAAQLFLGFGGLEARAGVADPKSGGHSATFEADLGYIGMPALRTTLGLDFFGSEVDRVISGQQVGGTLQRRRRSRTALRHLPAAKLHAARPQRRNRPLHSRAV